MNIFDSTQPAGYVLAVLGLQPSQLQRDQRRDDRGASAVEWVLISALVVGIALAVGLILKGALESEATDIGNKIKSA